MKISKIDNNFEYRNVNRTTNATLNNTNYIDKSELLMAHLNNISAINSISFAGQKYELGLSHDELVERTSKERFGTIELLSYYSPEFQKLKDGDRLALKHLVKAANIIGEINMKLDDENNIPFKKYLEKEITKGNKDAVLTKKLFDGQKGAFSQDMEFNHISLIKGMTQSKGKGVYPRDLSVEEFHSILEKMIHDGEVEEVRKILNQRSVVVRDGDKLKGIDFIDYFKKDFSKVADELEKAAKYSTNEDFNEFLRYQAEALRTADPMLDAYADKKWATLQDTPLEFTITRENYDDKMTETIFDNDKLLSLLANHGITPIAKDFIGGRVGIVNKEGTDFILGSKDLLPELAKLFDVTVDDLLNDSIDLTVIKEEPVKKEQIVNRRSMLDYLLMIPIGLFFGILLFMFYVFGFMSVGFMFFFLASTIIGPLFGVFTLFIQDVLSFNYVLMSIVIIIGSLGLIYPTFLLTFKWKDKYLELVKKVTKWLKNYNWKKVL